MADHGHGSDPADVAAFRGYSLVPVDGELDQLRSNGCRNRHAALCEPLRTILHRRALVPGELMRGVCHEAAHPILDALQERFDASLDTGDDDEEWCDEFAIELAAALATRAA